jgi:hypothetical protein
LGMFSLGVQAESRAKMSAVSLGLAQAKLEELVATPYSDIESSIEDYGEISGFEAFKREADVSYWDPLNSTTTEADLEIKRVIVSVFWDSDQKNTELITLIGQ